MTLMGSLNLLYPVTWNLVNVVDCMSKCRIMSNQGHGLLSHFTLVLYIRPRYQVLLSVYKTIGPLVIFCFAVAMCDLVHNVEKIFHLSNVVTASGIFFSEI